MLRYLEVAKAFSRGKAANNRLTQGRCPIADANISGLRPCCLTNHNDVGIYDGTMLKKLGELTDLVTRFGDFISLLEKKLQTVDMAAQACVMNRCATDLKLTSNDSQNATHKKVRLKFQFHLKFFS
jgi:hypothetical protein